MEQKIPAVVLTWKFPGSARVIRDGNAKLDFPIDVSVVQSPTCAGLPLSEADFPICDNALCRRSALYLFGPIPVPNPQKRRVT